MTSPHPTRTDYERVVHATRTPAEPTRAELEEQRKQVQAQQQYLRTTKQETV